MPVLSSCVTTMGSILKYFRDISIITGRSGGTTVEMMTPVIWPNSSPAKSEEVLEDHGVLVGRDLRVRADAPVFDESFLVEHSEDHVGIADVDG